MKLLMGGLFTAIAIGFYGTAVHAQAIASDAIVPDPSTPARTQSAPLVTHPASINQVPHGSGSARSTTPYTADQLNGILGTLEAKPKPPTTSSKNSIESLIERFANSEPTQTTIDPIDFFKPPALDGGVKIPLQR